MVLLEELQQLVEVVAMLLQGAATVSLSEHTVGQEQLPLSIAVALTMLVRLQARQGALLLVSRPISVSEDGRCRTCSG
jgi:hypothetical protein